MHRFEWGCKSLEAQGSAKGSLIEKPENWGIGENSGVRMKKFRGVQGYGRPRRIFAGEFSKICKNISEEICKNADVYFGLFFKES